MKQYRILAMLLWVLLIGCTENVGKSCEECAEDFYCCAETCCPNDHACVDGACVQNCADGLIECDGACVDPNTHPAHCSACNVPCQSDEVCSLGACSKGCNEGLEACGQSCVNIQTNPAHCGACDKACGNDEVCVDGACVCPEGLTLCGETCVDTQTDPAHCNACHEACDEGRACVQGACTSDCVEPLTHCGDSCYDLSISTRHCGKCYNRCNLTPFAAEMRCVDGACEVWNCDDGALLCGDECKDVENDNLHCGQCDKACGPDETCREGVCQWQHKMWGTKDDDEALAIAYDAVEEAFYITGYTTGAFDGQLLRGKEDVFLSKLDADGAVLWTKQWGTSVDDRGVAVQVGADDAVYVAGTTQGSFDSIITTDGRSPFLTKFTKDGEHVWDRQFGTMQNDDVMDMALSPEGNVYLIGFTEGNMGDFLVWGGVDIFGLKVDSEGSTIWNKQWGSSQNDYARGVKFHDNHLYVVGTTHGNMHDGILPGSYMSPNAVIMKLKDTGSDVEPVWTKEYGSLRPDTASELWVQKEKVEITVNDEKITKEMPVVYIIGQTTLAEGGHFDGYPTPEKGIGLFMAKFSEDGERLASQLMAREDTYYRVFAFMDGFLADLPTTKLWGLLVHESKDASFSNVRGAAWQLLDTGHWLESGKYIGEESVKAHHAISIGSSFYVVGSAIVDKKRNIYLEKVEFSL